jgi:glycosyltransferase involved in cell wall biosynthesis
MKIALICKNINSPSYIFYKDSLKKIEKKKKYKKFFFEKFSKKTLNKNFDIFLFMSGTFNENFKKKRNVKYGIIDPRAANYDNFRNFDFIIANGLEEKIFFSYTGLPTLIYPVFPSVKCNRKNNQNKTIITYHGNKEHLQNMFPRITNAIKKLSRNYTVELRLIYNIKNKGVVREINKNHLNCAVSHIQYYDGCLNRYLSDTDIGIVPQLKITGNKSIKKNIGYFLSKQIFKKQYSFSLNFKETTNLGRHLVFAQCKIPVISDYSISSSNFINNKKNGLLAYDTDDWYQNLKYLIENKKKSKQIGTQLFADWRKDFSHEVLNIKLFNFLKELNVK